MIFIGIDPGSSGAIAAIGEDGKIEFFDTPTFRIKSGRTFKNKQDPAQCAMILNGITAVHRGDVMIAIEKVAPMPDFRAKAGEEEKPHSMGATSAFNFGEGFGMWQGICAGLLLPYQLVHPATWKRHMMADMNKDKDASRQKVMQLYPQCTMDISRRKDHARADALLIATYAKRTYNPSPVTPEAKQEPLQPELW